MADNVNTPPSDPTTPMTTPPSSSSAPTVPDRPTNKPAGAAPMTGTPGVTQRISRHRLVDYFRPDDGTPHVSVCVRANADGTVNLHVFDDGESGYSGVVKGVTQGKDPGCWDWPARV